MGESLKLAWRNMWRNWRRTAIALIAIVLGLVLLLFMGGMIEGSDQAVFGNAVRIYGGNIQIHAPGFRAKANRLPLLPLENPAAVIQTANARDDVVAATQRITTSGLVINRGETAPVAIMAIEPSAEEPTSIQAENVTAGRFLLDGDESAIFIGQGLADKLGVAVGDRVNLLGRRKNESMRQHSMTIVGIFDLGMADVEKGMVFITLPQAQMLYNLRDQVTEVAVTLETVGQEAMVMDELQRALPAYEVDSWETLRPEFRETMDMKSTATSAFSFVVLLIASIGILNLMLMAVFERTREMGVLAALGMKGRRVMLLFLLEGAMIGAVGAVIGGVLGLALLWWVSQVGISFAYAEGMGEIVALMGERIYPTVSPAVAIKQGIGVVVIAALASLYPAWVASRKEPAEALHHV